MLAVVAALILALGLLMISGYEFQRDTPFERRCDAAKGTYLLTETGEERCAKISEIFIPPA